MERASRLLCASCIGAAQAATAFSIVILGFLLCTPGDAGLSLVNVITILLFSAFGWILAFVGFLCGMLTVGLGVYAVLTRLGLTGLSWAAGSGAVLTGWLGWGFFVADYVTLTGVAIAAAAAVGGAVGALSFRRAVYRPIRPRQPPPAPPF